MDTIDYDHTLHTSSKGDESLYVQFYMSYEQNYEKSEQEGRPIYDDVPFVRIFVPGDRTNVIDRQVRMSNPRIGFFGGDDARFPKQWAQFKEGQEQRSAGTPLAEWPVISRGQAEELKFFGFDTVEQIAGASDQVLTKHMGLQDLKNRAKAYLEIAKGNTAPIEQMQAQLKEMSAQFKVLQEAHEKMMQENKELTAKVVKQVAKA